MKCRQVHLLLPEFVHGNSPAEEHDLVQRHLSECPVCTDEVIRMDALMTDLKKISLPAPPQAYWGSIVPRIHRAIERRSPPSFPGWIVRYLAPAAAFLLLVTLLSSNGSLERFDDTELNTLVGNLSGDELLQITDQTTLRSEINASTTANGAPGEIDDDDVETLQQLLTSEDRTVLIDQLDEDEAVSMLTEQEEERVLSVLRQQPIVH